MTRGSIQEYTEAVRDRYFRACKRDKGRILDEFVNVTGYRRKSAIRLLHRRRQGVPRWRCGRPKKYGSYVVEACGLYQTSVRCEFQNPANRLKKRMK